jgi:hypothetical protein
MAGYRPPPRTGGFTVMLRIPCDGDALGLSKGDIVHVNVNVLR